MAGEYLLDTNVVIAFFNGELSVIEQVADADRIAVPVVVLGELYFGAYKSSRVQENIERINSVLSDFTVVPCNEQTADHYGSLKRRLQSSGNSIPDNDIWVAATAVQLGLRLVSRDEHFARIENLSLVIW